MAETNVKAALGVAERIDVAALLLAKTPIGRPGRVPGTHEKRVLKTPFIIAYSATPQRLNILRIVHERRDWPDSVRPASSAEEGRS